MDSEISSNYSNKEDSPIIELHNNLVYNGEEIDFSLKEIADNLSIFKGKDEIMWGEFIVAIGTDDKTAMHAIMFDKFGISTFRNLNITKSSRYYTAIENLEPKYRDSNARRGLAVVLLKKYPLFNEAVDSESDMPFDYDQTHAGELASSATLVSNVDPEVFAKKLKTFGILPNSSRRVTSTMVDVVYENNEGVIDLNNQLVFYLGEQLEQLFNPVNEYSPEQTEYAYKPPEYETEAMNSDSELLKSVCNELLQLQTRFTYDLVDFLQNFLIVLRVDVLNEEIEGLSTLKLNRLFPPTIDEVTRINCIFLDSLKAATPYGAIEVLKACNITIPYFYKAYTRHEAATKNFSKDIKLFLNNFKSSIPRKEFSEMKLDALIKGPQEKLLKIKLIIDRLWESKEDWGDRTAEATKYYNNIIDVIVSFGKLEKPLHSYTTRVFTPSGKILTELAKGWPIELQYKWLKRRVVGVYDVIDSNDEKKRKLLVIFSDYVVFLDIQNSEKYYSNPNKPMLSDILTNSLINEVPLTSKIPKMKVDKFSYIDNMFVTIVDGNLLRFDSMKETEAFSFTCRLATKSVTEVQVADLLTKAKILEKDTAFHLFKAGIDNITVYSTAHEYTSYETEKVKSKVAVFLNMEPSHSKVLEYSLYSGLFVRFSNEERLDRVVINRILYDGSAHEIKVRPENLISTLIEQLKDMIPNCYSSAKSPMYRSICQVNLELLRELVKPSISYMKIQAVDKNMVTSSNTDNYETNHEKKKSYGTITTFRSYASDLKDLSQEEDENSGSLTGSPVKKTKIKKVEKHSVNTSAQTRGSPTKIAQNHHHHHNNNNSNNKNNIGRQTAVESPKKRGLGKLFKSIFKTQSSKNNSSKKNVVKTQLPEVKKSVQIRKKETVAADSHFNSPSKKHFTESRVSKTPKSSPRKKQLDHKEATRTKESPMKKIIVDSTEHTVAGKTSQSENRVTSVIHNNDFQKSNDTVQNIENINKEHKQSSHQPSGQIADNKREEEIQKDFIREISRAAKPKTDSGFSLPAPPVPPKNVLSLYDRDLFGSFGPKDNTDNIEVIQSPENHLSTDNIIEKVNESNTSKNGNDLNKNPITPIVINSINDEVVTKTELHEDSGTNLEMKPPKINKAPIFPKFSQQKPKGINFDRSASFIELYKGMRLVLDDTDANYNWKRLPSLVSLSNTKAINADENTHIFSTLTQKADIKPEMIKEESISDLVDNDPTMRFVRDKIDKTDFDDGQETGTLTALKSPFKAQFVQVKSSDESTVSTNKDVVNDFKNIFSDAKPEINKPNFRVVKTSPSRIVQLGKDENGNKPLPNISVTEDLSKISTKHDVLIPQGRLLEIKDSQTDLHSTFTKDTKADNSDSSIFTDTSVLGKRNVSGNTESSVDDDVNLSKASGINSSDLLEALDFSSFTLGFDDTTTTAEERNIANLSGQSGIPNSLNTQLRRPARRQGQGPQIYHLPKNNSNIQTSQAKNALGSIEEDPIWVSPSKMVFTDLGNSNSRATNSYNRKPSKINKSSSSKINMAREDSSFGYLSEYLTTQDDSNNLKFV